MLCALLLCKATFYETIITTPPVLSAKDQVETVLREAVLFA